MGFDPKAFGERIRGEMAAQGLDVPSLQREVRELSGGARGTSYGSVWSYANGQAPLEPRREVVDAMAKLFGVLPRYLLEGGARTAADAELLEQTGAGEGRFYKRMLNELPHLKQLEPGVHLALLGLMDRWATACQRSGRMFPEEEVEDRMIGFLLEAWTFMWQPIEGWARSLGREGSMDTHSLNDYLMAMCHAMNLSLHAVAPPGLTPEEVESWPKYPREEDTDGER